VRPRNTNDYNNVQHGGYQLSAGKAVNTYMLESLLLSRVHVFFFFFFFLSVVRLSKLCQSVNSLVRGELMLGLLVII
jgi:hypothetical protein